jgi:hypothetical protein
MLGMSVEIHAFAQIGIIKLHPPTLVAAASSGSRADAVSDSGAFLNLKATAGRESPCRRDRNAVSVGSESASSR